jgi:ComF family protein
MSGRDRTSGTGGIRDWLLELFFPTRCIFCRRLSGRDRSVCRACREKYPDVPAAQRVRRLPGLDCLSPLWYEGQAREALLRFKFRDRSAYAPVFGNFMRKCLDENRISCDSITWVPLSGRRLRQRGYDQARLLAEAIAAAEGLSCEKLLEKERDTPAQSGMGGREARRRNAAGAYRAADPARVAGKHVLLVDDIVTTGATLRECARVLKAAGARSVTAVTAAQTRD